MKFFNPSQLNSRLTSVRIVLLASAVAIAPVALADGDEEQAMREANFKAADADGDGALTQEEFRVFIDANARDNVGRAATVKRFGAYDRAFNRVDQDGSGTVTWSEIMQGLAEAN